MLSSSGDKHPADNRRCFHKAGDFIWHTVYLNKMAAVVNPLMHTVVMAGPNSAVMTSCGLWNHLWSLGIAAAIHALRPDPMFSPKQTKKPASAVMTSCGQIKHPGILGIVAAIHILRTDSTMLSGILL
jgi:hypothetical protein